MDNRQRKAMFAKMKGKGRSNVSPIIFKKQIVTPLGNIRTAQVRPKKDRLKKLNFVVEFGTNNRKQFRKGFKTKEQAIRFAKKRVK